MALPPEVRANYISIVDSILSTSDLSTISEKRIRNGIQAKVEYDITPQKASIKELIMERFDIFNARQQNGDSASHPPVKSEFHAPKTNGFHHDSQPAERTPPKSSTPTKREADTDDTSDSADNQPASKKRKTAVDDDAQLAARLQAEEERLARPTRGGTSRKGASAKKKTPKKKNKNKTSAKIGASDDSDLEGSETEKPKRNTGFHKPLNLSPALSSLFDGETTLSRPQTTKRIWDYIKGRDLQDPSDKRYIICDERMREVFKTEKVHMFQMTKILNQNLYNPDE